MQVEMEATTFLDGVVSVDPEVLRGTPVFSKTRVPIENLFEFLSASEVLAEFFEAFPRVSPDQVQRILQASMTQIMSITSDEAT